MSVIVEVDTPQLDRLADASRHADVVEEVSMRAEEMMRPYVPVQESILRDSAQLHSDFRAGEIIWSTPYAAKHYYVPMDHTDPAGKATDHWDEAMMEEHGDELAEYAGLAYMGGR